MNSNKDENIKRILNKASEVKAPESLASGVLNAWKAEQQVVHAPLKPTPPLLSRGMMLLIAAVFIGVVLFVMGNAGEAGSGSTLAPYLDAIQEGGSSVFQRLDMYTALGMAALAGLLVCASYVGRRQQLSI